MFTDPKGSVPPKTKRAFDRTVADVAREAFENSVMEGDRPDRKRQRTDTGDDAASTRPID